MKPVIIIGSGHAGLSMARELRTRAPRTTDTAYQPGTHPRLLQTLTIKSLEHGQGAPGSRYKTVGELETELNVQMDSQTQVQTIEPQNQSLRLKQVSGNIETLFYQNLVLATEHPLSSSDQA